MKKIIDMLKSMTNSKKKVFALALSVCVVVLSIASSSIAYFTDTETYTNTFTSGKVDIAIKVGEVTVDETNYSVQDKAVPGTTIERVTSISVNTGSEDAYLGAVITITGGTNLLTKNPLGEDGKIYAANLFKNIQGSVTVEDVMTDSVHTGFVIRIVFASEYSAGGYTDVFDGISIPGTWDTENIEIFKNVRLDVVAYGVQSAGFNGTGEGGAAKALYSAFPAVFPTT